MIATVMALLVAAPPPPMIIVDERNVVRQEPPPHGNIGMSTAYRISDSIPGRSFEFRKRVLHPGAAIGQHPIAHDEIYYVMSGRGEVSEGGRTAQLTPGMGAYLYSGSTVAIKQVGDQELTLLIVYPGQDHPQASPPTAGQ